MTGRLAAAARAASIPSRRVRRLRSDLVAAARAGSTVREVIARADQLVTALRGAL